MNASAHTASNPIEIAKVFRPIVRTLLPDFEFYRIYSWAPNAGARRRIELAGNPSFARVDGRQIGSSTESRIRKFAGFAGVGAETYACFEDDHIVSICSYWHGERYRQRGFWPLALGEAKLVELLTLPEMRGRGIATALVAHSAQDMAKRGYSKLFARVWHSNGAAERAFLRAGWAPTARVIGARPFGCRRPVRIRF